MSSKDTSGVPDPASPHTVKKFELIAGYVEAWKEKLLNIPACKNLIFIDCMSSSGEYTDIDRQQVSGTPVRVAKLLREAASRYPDKNIYVIFNDRSAEKIEHLESLIDGGAENYHVSFYNEDCNMLIRDLWQKKISGYINTHYLLMYDPYKAAIDWNALRPFLNGWGEVIINHMLSDTIRAAGMAKRPETVHKYETTYQEDLAEIIKWSSDKKAYRQRIESIIRYLHTLKNRKYFVASFPFFNRNNALLYELLLCTGNEKGFTLFKETAWKVFGGSSSNKDTHKQDRQRTFEFFAKDTVDEYCYNVDDIVRYVQETFRGRKDVPFTEVWAALDHHPVFPSKKFKHLIRKELTRKYSAVTSQSTITFSSMEIL